MINGRMGAKTISWDWSKTRDKERDMKMRQNHQPRVSLPG